MKKKTIMKRLSAVTLSAMMLFTAFGVTNTAFAADASGIPDGVYTGKAQGFRSVVTMEVTVKDGKIVKIADLPNNEDRQYWKQAMEIVDTIIEKQSTDVDTIAGATFSSQGIKSAVNAALCGEDPTPDASIFESGTGTAEDPFLIKTSNQLRNFASSLTGQRDYKGYYVALAGNIDLNAREWAPVGGDLYAFDGTFDGRGYTIKNLHIGTKKEIASIGFTHVGLFGILGSNSVVKNVTLDGLYFNVDRGDEDVVRAGGIAGEMNSRSEAKKGAVIDSCYVNGDMTVAAQNQNVWTGGLIGTTYNGAIINCGTDVDIYADMYVDAENYGGWLEAGGITGMNLWTLVSNSYTTGDITGDYSNRANPEKTAIGMGGLTGMDLGVNINSFTTGNITSVNDAKCIGALTGISERNGTILDKTTYYNKDAKLTAAGKALPVQACGEIEGDVVVESNAIDGSNIEKLAATLNDNNAAGTSVDLALYDIDSSMLKNFTETTAPSKVSKKVGNKAFSLDAKVNNGKALTYKSSKTSVANVDSTGKVTVKGAGTAAITVKAAASNDYISFSGFDTKTVKVTVQKGSQTLNVSKAAKTVKANTLKKKAQTTSKVAVSGAKGKISYKKVQGSSNLSIDSKTGKIKVKKGTREGTYSIKVKVSAKATSNYNAAAKTVTVKVNVK